MPRAFTSVVGVAAVVVLAFNVSCATSSKPASHATSSAPTAAAVVEPTPKEMAPQGSPWPATKAGAVWTVIGWEMNDAEVEAALKQAGLTTTKRTEPNTAVDVTGAKTGWKASVSFDKATSKVSSIIVRADSVTVEDAHDARARLEERFGAPKESRVHSSRLWETKGVEIEGNHQAPWRVTESMIRSGDAKGGVDWRTLKSLSWGMSLGAARTAMKTSGFTPEKIAPPPPPPPPSTPPKPNGKKKAVSPKPQKPMLPATAPKGAKLIELTFRNSDEHVQISIIDKTGLYKVSVGQDVTDRKAAEKRARDVSSGLGSCTSEAETESSLWHDTIAYVRLSITGFQGQRIVSESYTNPASASEGEEPTTASK